MKEKRIRAEPFNRGRGIHQGLDLQRFMDAAANVWFFRSDKMSFSFAFRNGKYLSWIILVFFLPIVNYYYIIIPPPPQKVDDMTGWSWVKIIFKVGKKKVIFFSISNNIKKYGVRIYDLF